MCFRQVKRQLPEAETTERLQRPREILFYAARREQAQIGRKPQRCFQHA